MESFSLQEMFDAAVKNGLPHNQNGWFERNEKGIVGACYMGQGAINLGVANLQYADALNQIEFTEKTLLKANKKFHLRVNENFDRHFYTLVIWLNDTLQLEYSKITKIMQYLLKEDKIDMSQIFKLEPYKYNVVYR